MFATPDEAEQAFYTAFANTDLTAMMAVWLESDTVTCVHPVGPRISGLQAVKAGWAEIFRNTGSLKFRLGEVSRTQDGLLAIHVLHEHISVPGESGERPPAVATNIYQLTEHGWRMILHHASPVATPVVRAPTAPAGKLH
jgi:ketosteroid isomerase-like protein